MAPDILQLFIHGAVQIPATFPKLGKLTFDASEGAPIVTAREKRKNGLVVDRSALMRDVVALYLAKTDAVKDPKQGEWVIKPQLDSEKIKDLLAIGKTYGVVFVPEWVNILNRFSPKMPSGLQISKHGGSATFLGEAVFVAEASFDISTCC